jgi:hypothetical protein
MTDDVAELLVLLHGARRRISTVRATVGTWRHVRRHGEALQRSGSIADLVPVRRDLDDRPGGRARALHGLDPGAPARGLGDSDRLRRGAGSTADGRRRSTCTTAAGHPGEDGDYEPAQPNPWRTIDRDGRRLDVREPAESWRPAQVRLELDGTRILIHSTALGADALADVAGGLVPAPSEPPKPGA